MAFKQAKNIVDSIDQKVKNSPEKTMRKTGLRASYAYTKEKMGQVVEKTNSFIDKVNYKGSAKDKSNYVGEIRSATNTLIADDKVMLGEFRTYQEKVHTKTDNLKERIILQQRAAEELAFQKLQKENVKHIANGNFKHILAEISHFEDQLTDVSKTDQSDILESGLKLDFKIAKEKAAIAVMGVTYKQRFAKEAFYLGPKGINYSIKDNKDGMISYYSMTDITYDKDDPKKTTPIYQYTKIKKMPWLQFKRKLAEEICILGNSDSVRLGRQPKSHHSGLDGEPHLVFQGFKEKSVNIPKGIMGMKTGVVVYEKLKQITQLFTGEFIKDEKDPEKRAVMQKALDETYTNMRLYFQKDANGILRPTEEFSGSNQLKKLKILGEMVQGLNKSTERQGLEKALANCKESQVNKKLFLEGELAFFRKDNYQTYAKFSKFVRQGKNPKYLKLAKIRLAQSSYYFINLAEKYVAAAVGKQTTAISNYNKNSTFKFAHKVLSGMRKALKEGKAFDLESAYTAVGRPWDSTTQRFKGADISKMGLNEQRIRVMHMPFVLKLSQIAQIENPQKQRNKLLVYAKNDKKEAFRKAANILYKEYMQADMRDYIGKQKKTDKYWEDKRKEYKRLAWNQGNASANKEIAKIQSQAEKLAKKIGGKKYETMSQEDKNKLIKKYRLRLTEVAAEKNTGKKYFKKFLRAHDEERIGAKSNKGASQYINQNDPFDEWFKLSDEGWDTAKALAGEAVILGCSAGVGNLVGKGVNAGIRFAAKKYAEKGAIQLLSRGAGLAIDLVSSEALDRGMRTMLLGQKGLFSRKEMGAFLKHSLSTYGVLRLGGAGHGKLVEKLMKVKGLKNHASLVKYAASISSALSVEAPLMGTLNWGFSGFKGSWASSYGQALMTVMASRAGLKLFHGAAGGKLLRLERRLELKASLYSLKAKDPAKGALIERMMGNRETSLDSVAEMMHSDMSANQIKAYHDYLNNTENAGFLMKYKLAERSGRLTDEMKKQFENEMVELVAAGFSKSQAKKLANNITLEEMVRKYGFEHKSEAKTGLKSAMREQSYKGAKESLTTNLNNIKTALGKLNVRKAFAVYMLKYGNDFGAFAKDHPKMAKLIENAPLLIGLGALGAAGIYMITGGTGLHFDLSSLKSILGATAIGGLGMMKYKPMHNPQDAIFSIGNTYLYQHANGYQERVKVDRYNAKGDIFLARLDRIGIIIISNQSGPPAVKKLASSVVGEYIKLDHTESLTMNKLAEKLRNEGLPHIAAELLSNGTNLSTGHVVKNAEQASKVVDEIINHSKICDELKTYGMGEAYQKLKFDNGPVEVLGLKANTFRERANLAIKLKEMHQKLNAMQKQIDFLRPKLKEYSKELTDYKDGTNAANRFELAYSLLDDAARFRDIKINPEDSQKLIKILKEGPTHELIVELSTKYGGNPELAKNKAKKKWRSIKDRFKREAKSLDDNNAEKVLENEIVIAQRNRPIKDLSRVDDVYNEYPLDRREPTFDEKVNMAKAQLYYDQLKAKSPNDPNFVDIMKSQPQEILDAIFRQDPTGKLKDSLSQGQLNVLLNKLAIYKKDQGAISKLKNDPQAQEDFVRQQLLQFTRGNMTLPKSLKGLFRLEFGGEKNSEVYIYTDRSLFEHADINYLRGEKGYTQMSPSRRAEVVEKESWAGGYNINRNIHLFKGMTRGDSMVVHEGLHYHWDVLGMNFKGLSREASRAFFKGDAENYYKYSFLNSYNHMCDEIVAYTGQFNGETKASISHRFTTKYDNYYTKRIDQDVNPQLYAIQQRKFREAYRDAIDTAFKILQHELGPQLLRQTPPGSWNKLLNDLNAQHGQQVETKNAKKLAADAEYNFNMKLETPGDSLTIHNASNKTIRITMPGGDSLEIVPSSRYGHLIVNSNDRVQFKGLHEGTYYQIGRTFKHDDPNYRFDFRENKFMSRHQLDISRDGDTIKITHLSNSNTTQVESY